MILGKRLLRYIAISIGITIIVNWYFYPFKEDRNQADKICTSIKQGMTMEQVLTLVGNTTSQYEVGNETIAIGYGKCWCVANLEKRRVKNDPGKSACPF